MAYPAGTYKNFKSETKGNKSTVRGVLAYQGLESVGHTSMYILPPVIVYFMFPHIGLGNVDLYVRIAAMIITFIVSIKIINRYFVQQPLLFLDKDEGTLTEFGPEIFEVKIEEIKDVVVWEETRADGMSTKLYRLEYVLPDGKKTSGFAFTSFNKAEELIKTLKTLVTT